MKAFSERAQLQSHAPRDLVALNIDLMLGNTSQDDAIEALKTSALNRTWDNGPGQLLPNPHITLVSVPLSSIARVTTRKEEVIAPPIIDNKDRALGIQNIGYLFGLNIVNVTEPMPYKDGEYIGPVIAATLETPNSRLLQYASLSYPDSHSALSQQHRTLFTTVRSELFRRTGRTSRT